MRRRAAVGFALAVALGSVAHGAPAAPPLEGVPRYEHVFVIVEENKDYDQVLDPAAAPQIAALADAYGVATRFFGEVHPSQGNYVALLGGDTFGIHDDDAFYCIAGATRPYCDGAFTPGYVDHTVRAPHLGDQLVAAGLSWKGYYEDLPEPGSVAIFAGSASLPGQRLYAAKHSGFMNFADVQADPARVTRIVGFDRLERDLASGDAPNFALIVPNQCNEMHGLFGAGVPLDCLVTNRAGLIRRGDAEAGTLVRRIQATPMWAGDENVAIVITFDEGGGGSREGCCGITPQAASNFGGGHIPTIVITNHGPRGVRDATPYSHYSLLRTIEDAFGIPEHLGHAADADAGVRPMTPLFATAGP